MSIVAKMAALEERQREATRREPYLTTDGTKVPSVTEVLSLVSDAEDKSDVLCRWAVRCAEQGKDWFSERRRAAEVGTAVHKAIECELRGEIALDVGAFLDDEQRAQAQNAFAGWRRYKESHPFAHVATEHRLVSDVMGYGGTMDVVAVGDDGRRVLVDFKTSSSIWPSHVAQLAAYAGLWNGANSLQSIEEYRVVRLSKKGAEYQLLSLAANDDRAIAGWCFFTAALSAFRAAQVMRAK